MSSISAQTKRTWQLSLLTVLTSAAINPWTASEPINAPKLFFLAITGSLALLIVFENRFLINEFIVIKLYALSCIVFLCFSTVVLVISPSPLWQQIFGVWGRNTGFIFFISIVIISLAISLTPPESSNEIWEKLFFIFGSICVFYGYIQALGIDPFEWSNRYSKVIGFFGNPNFMSAFLGFFSIFIFTKTVSLKFKYAQKIALVLFNIFILFLIVQTESTQGLVLYVFGISYSLFAYLFQRKKVVFYRLWFSVMVIGSLCAVLDMLQKTPWRPLLYQPSISERGDLWRASLRILRDYPITGVGFDGFGDYYRAYRDYKAFSLRGSNVVGNTVHNVFLDMFVNGGVLLGLLYLALVVLIGIAAMKVISRIGFSDSNFNGFLGMWLGFQLQSLISMNQIGISVWGWVFGGIILKYYMLTVIKFNYSPKTSKPAYKNKSSISGFVTFIFVIMGIVIGFGPARSDIIYMKAIESRQIQKVKEAASIFPRNSQTAYVISELFRQNELPDLALETAERSIREFPRNYNLWKMIWNMPECPENLKLEAKDALSSLEPNETFD